MPDELDLHRLARQHRGGEARGQSNLAADAFGAHDFVVALLQAPDHFIGEETGVGRSDYTDRVALVAPAEAASHVADEVKENHWHDKSPEPGFAAAQKIAKVRVNQKESVSQHT